MVSSSIVRFQLLQIYASLVPTLAKNARMGHPPVVVDSAKPRVGHALATVAKKDNDRDSAPERNVRLSRIPNITSP